MKRIRLLANSAVITVINVALILGFATPVAAFQPGVAIENPTVFDNIESVINALLGLVRPIIVLTLLGILTYAGYVYLTAQDSDEKVGRAKKMIVAAVVGFIIIILAPAIVQFVAALFGIRSDILGL